MAGGGSSQTRHPFGVGDFLSPEEVHERCSVTGEAMVEAGGTVDHHGLGVGGRPEVVNVAHGATVPG